MHRMSNAEFPQSPPTLSPEAYEAWYAQVGLRNTLSDRMTQLTQARAAEAMRDNRFENIMFVMAHATVCSTVDEANNLLLQSFEPRFLLASDPLLQRAHLEPRVVEGKPLVPDQRHSPYNLLNGKSIAGQLLGVLMLATVLQPPETQLPLDQERKIIDCYEANRKAQGLSSVHDLLYNSKVRVTEAAKPTPRIKRLFSTVKQPRYKLPQDDRVSIKKMRTSMIRFKGRHYKPFRITLRDRPLAEDVINIGEILAL